MATKVGLKLDPDTSLKVGWLGFSKNLMKAVTEGFKAFNGDYKSGAGAALALGGAAKSIKHDIPVGARALELILLCFAWTFDSLRVTNGLDAEAAKAAAKRAIDELKRRAEAGALEIPFDFFEQPTAAEPYQLLREEFLRARDSFRPSAAEDENVLRARFDSGFKSAIWEVWAGRSPIFEELAKTLESPAAQTADFERQWRAYRESLINQFHVEPVFGQEETRISLGQLHVPLRCFWREIKESGEPSTRFVEDITPREQTRHVALLADELKAWMDNDDPDDWLRLLGGGPGSGKSTSAKAFAAEIGAREDLRPIYIPLQKLRTEGRLRDNINNYFRDRSGSPFDVGPIERKNVENAPPLVLIFDGLDEIARPGASADDIARDMIGWISDLRADLMGDTQTRHRVLVTGRMPSFQAARRRLNLSGNDAVEVLDFLPVVVDWEATTEIKGDEALIEADQREAWWAAYSAALGRPARAPASMSDPQLQSLTAEPLLCYLLALSGYLEENSDEAAENRNRVYERLFHDVWERGWGGGRTGTGKNLPQADFDRLFETMALAAWHGGDERVATPDRFHEALKVTRAGRIYDDFRRQDGGDVSNLAVNFYLKRSEEEARGFEFTHKSFGEYLTARALITAAKSAARLSVDRMEVALDDWLAAVGEGRLSDELLKFLRDEARLLQLDSAQQALRQFEKMMSKVIADGFSAHVLKCETWREAEDRQRNAEIMLMAVLHSVSSRVAIDNEPDARIRIDWRDDNLALGNLLHRVRGNRDRAIPALNIFSRVEAPGASLIAVDLITSNFISANLEGAECIEINFKWSDLKRANLARAGLRHANLMGAGLQKANLREAILDDANLRDANLRGADLGGAILQEADLRRANLQKADLRRANLQKADLRGANLRGANLRGANLQEADLRGANLNGTNLTEANFDKAKLDGANLDGAKGLGSRGSKPKAKPKTKTRR